MLTFMHGVGGFCLGRWCRMCGGHETLFSGQSVFPSLPIYHQCTAHVLLFSIITNNCAFSVLFLAKTSALKMQISNLLVPKTPNFSRKIHSLPYLIDLLETCTAHIYKKVESAPPPGMSRYENYLIST